jgi:hypothetical protein
LYPEAVKGKLLVGREIKTEIPVIAAVREDNNGNTE